MMLVQDAVSFTTLASPAEEPNEQRNVHSYRPRPLGRSILSLAATRTHDWPEEFTLVIFLQIPAKFTSLALSRTCVTKKKDIRYDDGLQKHKPAKRALPFCSWPEARRTSLPLYTRHLYQSTPATASLFCSGRHQGSRSDSHHKQ